MNARSFYRHLLLFQLCIINEITKLEQVIKLTIVAKLTNCFGWIEKSGQRVRKAVKADEVADYSTCIRANDNDMLANDSK